VICGVGFEENDMRTIITAIICTVAMSVMAEPKIEVMPELTKQVSALAEDNRIPWYKTGEYEIMVTAKLNNIVPLVRTTHGDYHYTLNRIRFHSVNVIEGTLDEKELSFYIERQFPTPKSGIKFKELWPFQKGCVRVFKLKRTEGRLQIVSMEMDRENPIGIGSGFSRPLPQHRTCGSAYGA